MKRMRRALSAILVLALVLALLSGTALAASGGWRQDSAGWWYQNADGSYPAGRWAEIGGKWYHFDAAGYMQTGWLEYGGAWYYLKPSGAMAVGWRQVNGAWYFFAESGRTRTGWLPDGDTWYYLKPSGAMAVGWRQVGGTWYYFDASGAMHTGWLEYGGDRYYLDASGAMATGDWSIDGEACTFDADGRLQDPGEDWRLILVNGDHPIPEEYPVTLVQLYNGYQVDERIYPALQEMFDDARAQGVDPVVVEGFRTHDDQVAMMELYVNRYIAQGYSRAAAESMALGYVAVPGTSEHELGIAVDIGARGSSTAWEVYTWLADNAWRYGFIQRYPYGKEYITETEYEPWHYRYVGQEAAWDIYSAGLTLEEYLGAW